MKILLQRMLPPPPQWMQATILTSPPSNSQLQNLPAPTVYAFYISRPSIDIYKNSTVPAFYNNMTLPFRVLQWTLSIPNSLHLHSVPSN